MQNSTYWAHSAPSGNFGPEWRAGWQLLATHLEQSGTIARELASSARPADGRFADVAGAAGLLHDFGKYTEAFQQMLADGAGRCQHAIHGAFVSYFDANTGLPRPGLAPLATAIAGHHAGLPDLTGDSRSLQSRFNVERHRAEALALVGEASRDCAALRDAFAKVLPALNVVSPRDQARFDLITRMLFSCLVDADRLNSSGREPVQAPLCAASRLERLLTHLNELSGRAPEGTVKQMRARVLEDCLQAASSPASLFSLTVPTGGGKTLAAMAFALRRAVVQPERFRRVIVVIPYLSIIEQNAQVYADVFGSGAVLEHHSGSCGKLKAQDAAPTAATQCSDEDLSRYVPDDDDETEDQHDRPRVETENWDAPLIVTTSVRFFESLFSNRARDLRRVHNIARSIVILDEVQTLPRRLLAPLLGVMKELADDWGVNFVFSTATQPAFERPTDCRPDPRWAPGTLTEIVRQPAPLRKALRRADIRWEIETPISWPQVAERVLAVPQCLAVVNLRRHAAELYAEVQRQARENGLDTAGVFHLSTRMCAAHRLRVLAEIRGRLSGGEACQVISTQLVEAGVDVDFPLVLRALAPLDSIVQAAGRADREGKRTAELGRPGGEVVVFVPEDKQMPPNEYAEAAGITHVLAAAALYEGNGIQVDSAAALAGYFERYYGEEGADLGVELAKLRGGSRGKFATLAEQFEMISSRTRDIFVPDDAEARAALKELRVTHRLTGGLRRRLQRHVVGLSPSEFKIASGVVFALPPGADIWIAVDQAYDERLGLLFEVRPEQYVT